MADFSDPWILITNMKVPHSTSSNLKTVPIEYFRGVTIGVDGRAAGNYSAETTTAEFFNYADGPNAGNASGMEVTGTNAAGIWSGSDYASITSGTSVPGASGNIIDIWSGDLILEYEGGIVSDAYSVILVLSDGTVAIDLSYGTHARNASLGNLKSISVSDTAYLYDAGFYDSATYDSVPVICFTANTLIETDHGNKPVEDLQPGDMISTMDDGYQPIRWIGSTKRDAIDLARNPKLRPIRIPAGALGNGLPKRDLTVSRQHRVLVRSKIAQRMFGTDEILIPAIKLVGMNGIEIAEDIEDVTYFHILFDKHQVIFSEDAPTESLFTGPEALKSVSPEARKEIETLFPQIAEPDFIAEPARLIPGKGKQIRQLVERHGKNGLPILNG